MGASDGIFGYTSILLVLIFWQQQSHSFEIRCPEQSEWSFKAIAKCGNVLEYFCLLDDNVKIYTEFCKRNLDIARDIIWKKGQKCVLRGNLDGEVCSTERYQPFKFQTDGNSDCAYEKSNCQDEGMIIYKNGSTTSDTQCRCDHTKGFAFTSKTKQNCYCIPSEEDCSCYKKECKRDFKLLSDYNCIFLGSQEENSACSSLDRRPAENIGSQNPQIKQLNRDITMVEERPSYINLTMTALIVFTIMIFMLFLKENNSSGFKSEIIRQNETDLRFDEQEEGHEGVKDKKKTHNLEEYAQETHEKESKSDNRNFIVSEADNCVLIIGRTGSGKTSRIRHIALKLCMKESFEIIPIVSSLSTISNYHNPNRKHIGDFCSKLFVNTQIDDYLNLMKMNIGKRNAKQGFEKSFFSTNEDIFNDRDFINRLQQMTPFNYKLSEKLITVDEKFEMIKKYLSTAEEVKLNQTMQSDVVYFPLLCKIPESKTVDPIVKLFTNLDELIQKGILELKDNSVTQFCIITLCTLFENRFNEQMLNESYKFKTSKENNAFNEICDNFNLGLHKNSGRMRLKDQLSSVTEYYVSKTGDYYSLIHSKVYQVAEIVCAQSFINCFIKFAPISFIAARYRFKSTTVEKNDNVVWINEVDTEKRYFNRLFMDLEEGITYSTFHNAQLCNLIYREKFFTYCKKRKDKLTELLLQIKESNKSLTLTDQSSPDDRPDYEDYIDFKEQYHFMDHKMRKPLIESAWEGCSDIIKMLLEIECDVDETDRFGRTALFVASYRNKTNVAKTLIESGAQHDLFNKKGQSPLFIASRHGNYDIIKALLKKKASTELCDSSGQTSLMVASICGNKDVVEALLNAGADISKCDNVGRSSLFLAILKERKDVVNVLIRNKANVHQCNKTGLSPLSVACGKENSDLLDILIKAGGDISKEDNDGRSPLFIACEGGFDHIVDILINKGANVMQCDWENKSPLLIACEKGHLKIVQSLIKNNSSIINLCDEDGRSPLFVACQKKRTEIARILLEKGANLNSFDNKSRSPFYAACRSGDLAIVNLLHTKGAKPNNCNTWGSSPLFVASREGHFDIVKYLINLKCDVAKADSNGKTPLIVACEEGNVGIARILIESGADVNLCDNEQRSSLHVACFCGYSDIVKLLIMHLVDQTLRDIDEHTPLEIAQKKEFTDIIELLTSNEL